MRKTFLLKCATLILAFLTGGVSINKLWAQTDVTSLYLHNADFELGYGVYTYPTKYDRAIYQPDGWTITYSNENSNDMTVLGQNDLAVGSFKNLGVCSGNNSFRVRERWGSKTSIGVKQNVLLPKGEYTLSASVAHQTGTGTTRIYAGSTEATTSSTTWETKSVSFTSDGSTPVIVGFSTTQAKTEEQIAGVDNFVITCTSDLSTVLSDQITIAQSALAELTEGSADYTNLSNAIAVAQAVTDATAQDAYDLLLATKAAKDGLGAATEDTPVLTSYVTNGEFEDNVDGWSFTTVAQNHWRTDKEFEGVTSKAWENWKGTLEPGKMYQVVTGLPNGTYNLRIGAWVRSLGEEGTQYVYVNESKTNITTPDPTYYTAQVYVNNHVAEIGLYNSAAIDWIGIDHVTLSYVSSDDLATVKVLNAAKAEWNAEIAKAQAQLATYEEGTAWYISLSEAIIAAQNADQTTVETLNAAVQALKEAEAAAALAYRKSLYADFANGEYYIKNVQSGKFLNNGAYWGTRAVLNNGGLVYKVSKGDDGKYTLVSGIVGADKALRPSDAFNDQSGAWEIFQTTDGVTLCNGSQYLYYDGTNIPQFTDDATADGAVWQFVSIDALKADIANGVANTNASFYIKDADFDNKVAGGVTAWKGDPGINSDNNGSGLTVSNSKNAQKWNAGSFDVYQEIADLPNGVYTLKAQAFYRHGNAVESSLNAYINNEEVSPVLYANSKEQPVMSVYEDAKDASEAGWEKQVDDYYIPNTQANAAVCFSADAYVNTITGINVFDGKLRIGIKRSGSAIADWTVFDSFRLTFERAITAADVWEELDAQKSELATGKMNADIATAQASANTVWEDAMLEESIDNVKAAFQAREDAIAAAKASAEAYAPLGVAIDEAYEFYVNNTFPGADDYEEAIDAVETNYNAGTYTNEEIPVAIEELKAAKVTYICSQTQSFDTPADYTGLMVNPSFETGDLTGWDFIASLGGDNGVKENSNGVYTMSNVDGDYLFNTWNSDANEKRYGILQTLKAPKSGWYSLSAVAGSDAGNKIILTLGTTTTTINAAENVMGTDIVEEDGELVEKEVVATPAKAIGVRGETDKVYFEADDEILVKVNSSTWFKADDFRLAFYGDGVKAVMAVSDAEWATFIAPFDVEIPEGVTAYTVDALNEDGHTLTMNVVSDVIEANTPVVLNSNAVVNEAFYGKAVEATNDLKAGLLTGVYENTEAPVGSYVLQKHDSKVAFYLVGEEVKPTVGANRAYLTLPTSSLGAAPAYIVLGGNATGISNAAAKAETNAVIYDITGRRVNNITEHGIYIINGKKTIK